jgi:two-component system nitrate/nitrite sensor histidine kinase NarX
MNKPMDRIEKPGKAAFFWTRDPELALPCTTEGADCADPQAPRINSLDTLLNRHLDIALGMTHARAGVVRFLLPDEQTLQVVSAVGLTREELEAERIVELACEECGHDAFRLGLCVADAESCATRQSGEHPAAFRSVISIPLKSRTQAEVLLGVFTLFFDTPQSPSGNTAGIALNLADMLGGLLEYIKATRETKRAELLAERQAIANDIHDSLAQTLNFARMNTKLLNDAVCKNTGMAEKYAGDIDEALETSQKVVRALITGFRSEIDPAGLLHALQDLTGQFKNRYGIVLDYQMRIADLDLPLEYEIQVFHIVREAFANIAKHSGASHARLIADRCCGYYIFTVEDNGIGTFSQVEGHYGMIIMRERAQRIGGQIRVESTKGLGTCVQLYFPEPATKMEKRA